MVVLFSGEMASDILSGVASVAQVAYTVYKNLKDKDGLFTGLQHRIQTIQDQVDLLQGVPLNSRQQKALEALHGVLQDANNLAEKYKKKEKTRFLKVKSIVHTVTGIKRLISDTPSLNLL